jgi:2-oxoglutarate ferredoxin oxidoreductase subunit beta
MDPKVFDMGEIDIAWCPGCGDYGILTLLKHALAELNIAAENLVMVSGIGQAAKILHYFKCNFFNGLHGRALPPTVAIKAANPSITVIAESGDGDMYGEGGNHFIHTIRRNPDITNIVHNNMVYGLTKGQASPTSQLGFKTPVQVAGVFLEPFNPLAVAIALDAGFVARAFIGDADQTKEIFKKAIQHRGYSLVDVFQPCVTFNRINTWQWFKEHTYYLEDSFDPHDRTAAFKRSVEADKLPLGVFYINPNKSTFEDNVGIYRQDSRPLFERELDFARLHILIDKFRTTG